MSDIYGLPIGTPYSIGYADCCEGRECISPWRKWGYKKVRENAAYVNGFMDAEEANEHHPKE